MQSQPQFKSQRKCPLQMVLVVLQTKNKVLNCTKVYKKFSSFISIAFYEKPLSFRSICNLEKLAMAISKSLVGIYIRIMHPFFKCRALAFKIPKHPVLFHHHFPKCPFLNGIPASLPVQIRTPLLPKQKGREKR